MEEHKMSKGKIGAIATGVIIILFLIILGLCTKRVPAGYVAVQYKMNGGISDKILTQGFHVVSPTTKTTLYSVSLEQSYLTAGKKGDSPDNEAFSASSKEGKSVKVELTYTYQYSPETVTELFTRFRGQNGKEVRDSFIKPNIVSWSKEVIARYAVADILGEKRATVNSDLTDYLSGKFKPYGIAVSNVSLINIEVDKNTQKAINQKIQAQQNAEKQAIENQTNIDKAKADAEAKKTTAQAEADAKLIEAEAEAKANKEINNSLSENVLKQQYIDKWDGKLPTVQGSGANTFMQISGDK